MPAWLYSGGGSWCKISAPSFVWKQLTNGSAANSFQMGPSRHFPRTDFPAKCNGPFLGSLVPAVFWKRSCHHGILGYSGAPSHAVTVKVCPHNPFLTSHALHSSSHLVDLTIRVVPPHPVPCRLSACGQLMRGGGKSSWAVLSSPGTGQGAPSAGCWASPALSAAAKASAAQPRGADSRLL